MENGRKNESRNRNMKKIPVVLLIVCVMGLLATGINMRKRFNRLERERVADRVVERKPYDNVMKSLTARSNALHFGNPPDGFQIVCDDSGKYAPKEIWPHGGFVWNMSHFVRTNRQDAIVAAWRVKEILEDRTANDPTPPPPPINWKPCE